VGCGHLAGGVRGSPDLCLEIRSIKRYIDKIALLDSGAEVEIIVERNSRECSLSCLLSPSCLSLLSTLSPSTISPVLRLYPALYPSFLPPPPLVLFSHPPHSLPFPLLSLRYSPLPPSFFLLPCLHALTLLSLPERRALLPLLLPPGRAGLERSAPGRPGLIITKFSLYARC